METLVSSSWTVDAIGDEEEPLGDYVKMDSVLKVDDGATGDSESEDIVLSTAVDDRGEPPDEDASVLDEDSAKD